MIDLFNVMHFFPLIKAFEKVFVPCKNGNRAKLSNSMDTVIRLPEGSNYVFVDSLQGTKMKNFQTMFSVSPSVFLLEL